MVAQTEKRKNYTKQRPPIRATDGKWAEVRDAFINRPIRPMAQELSAEFGIEEGTITRALQDQGWPMLRAEKIEKTLRECGAGEIITKALQSSRTIVNAGENFALRTFQLILALVDEVESKKDMSVTTRSSTLNTLTFAAVNVGQAMKHLGVVGLPKELANATQMDNGRWKPELLQQINVTLHNISESKKPTVEAAVTVETGPPAAADLV